MIFSRHQSTSIKGVAIVLLILHHLFLLPSQNRLLTGVFGGSGGGVEFFLSSVGKLCVPLFFFVSGYGLWQSSRDDCHLWRSILRRLQNIYTIYIVTVLVTVLLLFSWTGVLPLKSWRQAVETFLGWNVSINGSWWFFIIYVELLLLTPMAVLFVRRFSWGLLLCLSFVLYLLSAPASGFPYFARGIESIGLTSLLYKNFPVNFFWPNQLYFFTGFCLAVSGIFEAVLQQSLNRLQPSFWRYATALILIAAVLSFRYYFFDIGEFFGVLSKKGINIFQYITINTRADFILAPVFIFALVLLSYRHESPILSFLGNYSAAIWLIHGSIILIVSNILKPYHPWSPLVFFTVLFFCVLYALAYIGIRNLWGRLAFKQGIKS